MIIGTLKGLVGSSTVEGSQTSHGDASWTVLGLVSLEGRHQKETTNSDAVKLPSPCL